MEAEARTYLDHIAGLGGAVEAIEQGYIQREIQEAAWRFQQKIESGSQVIVGMNRFGGEEAPNREILRVDDTLEARQIAKVADVRARRDAKQVEAALASLDRAVVDNRNLLDPLMEAVKTYATLGEMVGVLKNHFGRYRPPSVL
jgi:methylmalonyl-CoA mutase N-terminal domain/subunit